VLKPGGHFFFSVWDRIEDNDFAHLAVETLARLYPANPPRFMARTPHGFHDKTVLERLVREAGFLQIEIDTLAKVSRAASAREPALGYCQGTPMRGEIEAQGEGELQKATDAVAAAIVQRFGRGDVEGRIQAIVVSAAV
jgi:hypothetical protein